MGSFCNLRRIVLADMRGQRGHQHQGLRHQRRYPLPIRLKPFDTVFPEGTTGIGQQADGLQHIENQHRFENVQFKITLTARNGDGRMIAHHLGADHGHGLALCWINLAWHDHCLW